MYPPKFLMTFLVVEHFFSKLIHPLYFFYFFVSVSAFLFKRIFFKKFSSDYWGKKGFAPILIIVGRMPPRIYAYAYIYVYVFSHFSP